MKIIPVILVLVFATLVAQAQTLKVDDFVKNIRQFKEYKTMKQFIEKRGFDYDTVLLPGGIGKLYSFIGKQDYKVIGIEGDTLKMKNAVFLRMDDQVTIRKLTFVTATKEFYEAIVNDMVVKKFKSQEHQDRSKPISYTSALFPGMSISLSVVEAVRDGKSYAKYQVSAAY